MWYDERDWLCNADEVKSTLPKTKLTILLLIVAGVGLTVSSFIAAENVILWQLYDFMLWWGVAFAIYLFVGIWMYRQNLTKTTFFFLLVVWAFLEGSFYLKISLLSGDIFRYLWDGRMAVHGFNPYQYMPADVKVHFLTHWIYWQRVGARHVYTPYPPGAEWFYALANLVSHGAFSYWFLKGIFVVSVFLGLMVSYFTLKRLSLPTGRLFLYAWNPLLFFPGAWDGHIDQLVLFPLSLTFYFALTQKEIKAGLLLGISTMAKTYAVLVAPGLYRWRQHFFKMPLATILAILAITAPYLVWGHPVGLLGGPGQYIRQNNFNGGLDVWIPQFLQTLHIHLGHPGYDVRRGLLGLYALLILGVVFTARDFSLQAILSRTYLLVAVWYLVEPQMYPWYFIWIIPLLVLRPGFALLYLSGASMLAMLTYQFAGWPYPEWIRSAQYVPFMILLVVDYFWFRRQRKDVHVALPQESLQNA